MTATTWRSGAQPMWRGWDRFDYLMFLTAVGLVVFGLLLIHSGSKEEYEGPFVSFANPVMKQVLFAFIGIVGMFVVSRIDYHYFIHYAWPLYAIGIISLIGILVIGDAAYGSRRWFDVGPVQVQPSEFAKLATVLALATFFSNHGGDARDLRVLALSLAIVLPPAFLVFVEPDLGTAIVFMCIWLGVVIVAGVSRSHLMVLGALAVALLPFVWAFLIADYQIDRIATLFDPSSEERALNEGYNVNQSKIAVGSGGWIGPGLGEGKQTQLGYLRVPTKDFIFSVAGEELGFVGCMGLFALLVLLLMRGIRAAQIAGDTSGQLLAVGIVVLILMQAFINIAVNLSLFPVTGIPLPFVSQGGSSLVSLFFSLGILQSILMRHRAYRQT